MTTKVKKKVGRKKGSIASKDKYIIKYHNKVLDTWDVLGVYPSLGVASEKLNLSYANLSDLKIGRSNVYKTFYKIELVERK